MKTGFLAGAAIAAAILVSVPAGAAEYTSILLEKVVNRTPDQTWAKIGPYCAITTWLIGSSPSLLRGEAMPSSITRGRM